MINSSNKLIAILLIAVVACLATVGLYYFQMKEQPERNSSSNNSHSNIIRFMPIGDSYTIGLGVRNEANRWPNLLVESLKKEGIEIELIANPSVSGYDAGDALDYEIETFEQAKPDFGTLFIGANDAFRDRPLDIFKKEYVELVDRMQAALTDKSKLVLITVPNYAEFPEGKGYVDEAPFIDQYNQIIREEAAKRNLKVVDLFLIDTMNSAEYFISDGVHPNAKGIKVWHDAILVVVREVLAE